MDKPFSPACERNRAPILALLGEILRTHHSVLEIGSGTGQHAVYFARHLPHLLWQTSDLEENHPGIRAWIADDASAHGIVNVPAPLTLDMQAPVWPAGDFDAVYTANTCHIMSWPQVQTMLAGVGRLLPVGGVFCIYGPFTYQGEFTSESNARFDASLRAQDAHRGIRAIEDLCRVAQEHGLYLHADHAMPANNRLLVLIRSEVGVVPG